MNLAVRNQSTSRIVGSASKTTAWTIADASSQLANLLTTGAKVAQPGDLIVLINALRFTRSTTLTARLLLDAIAGEQGTFEIRPRGAHEPSIEPMQLSTLFNVSFWNDLFGGKSASLFLGAEGGDAEGAVRLPISTIGVPRLTVYPEGVRDGDHDPRGRLHRWDEGGFYTGCNTRHAPGVVHFEGRFHLYYTTGRDGEIHHAVSDNGCKWTAAEPAATGFFASSGVCALAVGSEVVLFFRDGHGDGLVHVIAKGDPGRFERPPDWYCGLDIADAPAVVRFRDQLCAVGRAQSGRKLVAARYPFDRHRWITSAVGAETSHPPGLVVFRDELHLFHVDARGNGILHLVSSDGATWSVASPHYLGFDTSAGPRPFVHRGRLYVLFRDGGGRGVLAIRSEDGRRFSPEPDWYLGLNAARECDAVSVDGQAFVSAQDADGVGIMGMAPDIGR